MHIVDEFTGRILEGRRWSEGLHQAVEAKEGVHIKEENQTLATVTLQNYFRMYEKLAGMTGTANTEAGEFAHTYDLQVVSIPTNRPMVRVDNADFIYKTEDAKFDAAIDDIAERHEKGQPVLVGTISVEKSEKLSRLLEKRGIPHEVLNAKQHEREAEIVAQAGQLSSVTVATNMAGRGVDILLGGNPEGLARRECLREGLEVGTPEYDARYEELLPRFKDECKVEGDKVRDARRPLRARHRAPRVAPHRQPAARPLGPPGRPRREPLLPLARRRADAAVRHRAHAAGDGQVVRRRHAARVEDGLQGGRARAGHGRGPQLRDPQGRAQVRRGDERAAQDHLPAPPADPRRRRPARRRDRRDRVHDQPARRSVLRRRVRRGVGRRGLLDDARTHFPTRVTKEQLDDAGDSQAMEELLLDDATALYAEKEESIGAETLRDIERRVMLSVIDQHWREHLYEMDYLQEGINLRAMGQQDPLSEWQREGFDMFEAMMGQIEDDFVQYVFHLQVVVDEQPQSAMRNVQYSAPRIRCRARARSPARWRPQPELRRWATATRGSRPIAGERAAVVQEPVRVEKTPGRNEPCFCGSGKKYKLCHGR